MSISNILEEVNKAIFPINIECSLCKNVDEKVLEKGLCNNCIEKIGFSKYYETLEFDGDTMEIVGFCKYGEEVKELIHKFKYDNKRYLAKIFAKIFDYTDLDFDIIVPVPLYRSKLKKRGFNQSALIAKEIEKACGKKYFDALLRIKDTLPQSKVSAEERKTNVQAAFVVKNKALIYGKRVLLVDDILTTGSTATECAIKLLEAGAISVTGFFIALA